MKLLTINIPETERLPDTEREEILRRCLTSEEMRRYKKVLPPIVGMVPTAIAFGFFYMALFQWGWSFLPAVFTFVAIAVVSLGLALLTKVVLEVWILRSLVRRKIRKC